MFAYKSINFGLLFYSEQYFVLIVITTAKKDNENVITSTYTRIDLYASIYGNQAFTTIATTISYMALPSLLAYTGILYLGIAYSVVMTAYTGYNAIFNALSFYQITIWMLY